MEATQTLLQVSRLDEHAIIALETVVPGMASGFNINTAHGDLAVTGEDARAMQALLEKRLKARHLKRQVVPAVRHTRTTPITAMSCFGDGEPLELFDHSHVQSVEHASLYKTGELALPGRAPQIVSVVFANFQFNAMQGRYDPVFEVNIENNGVMERHFFFASAFRTLGL